jgi:ATP-binding cassette subfamily B protein
VSWRRVLQLLDAVVDVRESEEAAAAGDVRGELSFIDVSLTTERDVKVLDRVSFTVRPGESLAIVGASGSGKSTMAFLAARLLDPDTGVVTLDGRDLRTMKLADVRRHVVLVEQEPLLLHGTIAENIRYARPQAGDEDVQRAARASGIAAFVEGLPDQYRTVVGERGLALSAGERQRVAIARAFLADPTVLVLDEPTAALDPVSERHVTEGYEMVMRGRTTILISHRRDLALRADRIVVLEGASVVETGTPRELSARDSAFARLFGLDYAFQAAAVSSTNASNERGA